MPPYSNEPEAEQHIYQQLAELNDMAVQINQQAAELRRIVTEAELHL